LVDFYDVSMKRIGEMMTLRDEDVTRRRKKVEADEKTVFFLAERVVAELYGVRGRENISPRFWKVGKLFLSCANPLWANELWVNRDVFRGKINQELGYEGVSDIRTSE
jgi:hypothetical protein